MNMSNKNLNIGTISFLLAPFSLVVMEVLPESISNSDTVNTIWLFFILACLLVSLFNARWSLKKYNTGMPLLLLSLFGLFTWYIVFGISFT